VHRFWLRNPYVLRSEVRKNTKASLIIATYILVRIHNVPSQTNTCRTYITIFSRRYVCNF
jgi:hypothetical protein